MHFKTLPGADFSQVRTNLGHDSNFWGEWGPFAGYGFGYSHIFAKRGYFGVKFMWTYFYPDKRWEGDASKLTLSSIPLVGKHISFGDFPGYYSMILIPIIYLDMGYVFGNNVVLSLGTVYLWGLSPSIKIPLSNHWSLEIRQVIFLDTFLFDKGYRNFMSGFSFSYKF